MSWALLALVGVLVLLGSPASANLAYRGDYPIAGVSIADIASGREVVLGVVTSARVPFTGAQAGTGAPLVIEVVVLVALLLDVKRLTGAR